MCDEYAEMWAEEEAAEREERALAREAEQVEAYEERERLKQARWDAALDEHQERTW